MLKSLPNNQEQQLQIQLSPSQPHDAPSVSGAGGSNVASSGAASVTVVGSSGVGVSGVSAAGRVGGSAWGASVWRSDSGLVCRASAGYGGVGLLRHLLVRSAAA